jgi:transposase-like protein
MECHYCNSEKIVKIGSVRTIKKGLRQRYKCQDCAKTFYYEKKEGGLK